MTNKILKIRVKPHTNKADNWLKFQLLYIFVMGSNLGFIEQKVRRRHKYGQHKSGQL